jgi:hypothetical protein
MGRENIERIEDIIQWYSSTVEWLQNFAGALHATANQGISASPLIQMPSDIMFLTPQEVDSSLSKKLDQLSIASSFQLFASFEGAIRYDAIDRQRKARVGKDLRKIIRGANNNIKNLDVPDILNCWCKRYSIDASKVTIIKGLFQYRHWLAHGRYWDNINLPVKRSAITPQYIYELMRDCFDEFKRHEEDFGW